MLALLSELHGSAGGTRGGHLGSLHLQCTLQLRFVESSVGCMLAVHSVASGRSGIAISGHPAPADTTVTMTRLADLLGCLLVQAAQAPLCTHH